MTDGLKEAHRTAIVDVLRANGRVERAVLFGSRAKETFTQGSDVDIALFGEALTTADQARLAAAMEELPVPQRVDLLLYDGIEDAALRKHVRRDGIELYRKQEIEREHVVLVGERVECSSSGLEWPTATIEDISEKVAMGPFGSSIKVSTFVPDGVPIISGQHLHGVRVDDSPGFNFISYEHAQRLANANVRRGDVIFTHAGNIGQVAYIPAQSEFDRYVISQRQFYMRCKRSKTIPEFIALYFTSPEGQHQLLANSSQVGVPAIARPVTYLRTIEIPLPPLPEQRAIAHILGTLDDKIELNRRMSETLEATARAIFKDWFVDFGPVRAKMEGREPGLPPHITALFPDRLVDSELGELPEGWKVRPLTDLLAINPERRLQKGDSAPYLEMANMPTKGHVPDNVVNRPFGSGMRFMNGDTLVARITPCLQNGKTAFVDFLQNGQIAWGSTEYIVLRPKSPLPNEFAYCLARSQKFRDFAIQSMTGTSGRQRVQANALRQLLLACPTKPVADAFRDHVRPFMAQASLATRESTSLADLRDALLPKLMSGEIRLRTTEVAMDAVGARGDSTFS